EVGARDGRVRTTRYGEAKHVRNLARLETRASEKLADMSLSVKLDQAVARGPLSGVGLGDEIMVESRLFTGWCRVYGITRSTVSDTVTLTFTDPGGVAA
ncbi:MAG TPA: hypothetical protein VMZ71_12445, partial [Gemmataceae bacterium]|nr:hypothetical protein [Gemmataceae bacterium]